MENAIKTNHKMHWSYTTDLFFGICVIARDELSITVTFEHYGNNFKDVLKMNQVLESLLREPVSVEGLADSLADEFPGMKITVTGRAETHGPVCVIVGAEGDQ